MVHKYVALTGVGQTESTGIWDSKDMQGQGSLSAKAGLQRLKMKWHHPLMFYSSFFMPLSLQHFYLGKCLHKCPASTSGSETYKMTTRKRRKNRHAFPFDLYSALALTPLTLMPFTQETFSHSMHFCQRSSWETVSHLHISMRPHW